MINTVASAGMKKKGTSRGDEHDVYGSKYAMAVSTGLNKAKNAWVLNILMSAKLPGSSQYDREGGVRIQIADSELSDFFACMAGRLDRLELKRAASDLKKRFIIERKNDEFLVSLRTNDMGSACMVKVQKSDQLKLGILAFRAIMKNNGGIGQDVLYLLHKDIYQGNKR